MKPVEVIKGQGLVARRGNGQEIERLRVAAYCRVSTDSEDQLSSYKSQVQHYMEFIKSKSEWEDKIKSITFNNQKLIKEVVDEIDGVFLPVYPSEANMMAIDLSGAGISPKDMSNYLLKRKIFTREGEYTSNLFGDNYLRISYSIPEEQIKVFCEEFPKAVEALRK